MLQTMHGTMVDGTTKALEKPKGKIEQIETVATNNHLLITEQQQKHQMLARDTDERLREEYNDMQQIRQKGMKMKLWMMAHCQNANDEDETR